MEKTLLPIEEYKKIADSIPIMCVDAVIVEKGKYLLVRRKNNPLKGRYWTPGGRVYKGEKLTDAVIRKVEEETGLKVKPISVVGFYEDFYKENELGLDLVHTTSIVFAVSVIGGKISLDGQSDGYMWSDSIPEDLNLQMMFF